MTDEKRPLILWSGGLDSTFLMYQQLLNGPVDYIVMDGGQSRSKIRMEEEARTKALNWFAAQGLPYPHQLNTADPMTLAKMPGISWSQTIPWLIGALYAADHRKHHSVMIAYVIGDEPVHLKDVFSQTFEGLQRISKHGDPVPLCFPFLDGFVNKRRILHEIPRGLLECVWYCELPEKINVTPCQFEMVSGKRCEWKANDQLVIEVIQEGDVERVELSALYLQPEHRVVMPDGSVEVVSKAVEQIDNVYIWQRCNNCPACVTHDLELVRYQRLGKHIGYRKDVGVEDPVPAPGKELPPPDATVFLVATAEQVLTIAQSGLTAGTQFHATSEQAALEVNNWLAGGFPGDDIRVIEVDYHSGMRGQDAPAKDWILDCALSTGFIRRLRDRNGTQLLWPVPWEETSTPDDVVEQLVELANTLKEEV
jgi:hypothetical protein